MVSALLVIAIAMQTPDSAGARLDRLVATVSVTPGVAGGAVVMVQRDSILVSRGFGNDGHGHQVDPETTGFRAASVGKLFVATAAMQLAAEGRLDLDQVIGVYLTGMPQPGKGWPPVTLAQLLSHTAGVDDPFIGSIQRASDPPLSLAEYFLADVPSISAIPGAEANYSNHGVALAGLVVEAVSGRSFDRYADEEIFGPLGMTRSSYRQPPPSEWAASVAGDPELSQYRLLPYPAGSLVTTSADMGRFLAALVNNGEYRGRRILDTTALATMHRRVWSADPLMPGVALGFFESEIGGRRVLYHTGSRGHRSVLAIDPDRHLGVFVVLDATEGSSDNLLEEFVSAAFGAPFSATGSPATEPDLDRYAGHYRFRGGSRTSIEKLGQLFRGEVRVWLDRGRLTLDREIPVTLEPIGPDLFRTHDGMFARFGGDPEGRIGRLSVSGRLLDATSLQRLHWWERGPLHLAILVGNLAAAWGWLLWLFGATVVRRFRRRAPSTEAAPPRLPLLVGGLYAVTPLIGLGALATHPRGTVVELAPAVWTIQLVLTVASVLLVAMIGSMMARRRRGERLGRRSIGVAALGILVTAVLLYWRVVPVG
ncbi:MAG: serine hydrolase domain-containing protein [Gemmatimonadales bacterium]